MNTIEFIPNTGLVPNNPFASSSHNRYAFATQRQTEYLITLGERLKTKTWFVNGNHAIFVLNKVRQCQRIIDYYYNLKGI